MTRQRLPSPQSSIPHNALIVVADGGNAFPGTDPGAVARVLLPVLQAAKPPGPALTFTYDPPIERPRPNHHLVLIFNPANDLTSNGVCRGEVRFRPARSGVFNVYAVYCRNDQVMSEAAAWTPATDPADPRVDQLFRELFMVVFAESPPQRPDQRNDRR